MLTTKNNIAFLIISIYDWNLYTITWIVYHFITLDLLIKYFIKVNIFLLGLSKSFTEKIAQ